MAKFGYSEYLDGTLWWHIRQVFLSHKANWLVFWRDYIEPKYSLSGRCLSKTHNDFNKIQRIHTVPLERRVKKNFWHLVTSVISPSWMFSLVVNAFFISKQTKISAAVFVAMERTATNLLSSSKETSCLEVLILLFTETRCTSLASQSAIEIKKYNGKNNIFKNNLGYLELSHYDNIDLQLKSFFNWPV